jgi:WD40 repeat protein
MNRVRLLTTLLLLHGSSAFAQQQAAEAPPKPPSTKCMAFSPDGKSLAVAYSVNNSVVVWDVDTHGRTFVVKETSGISSIAYSPDGNMLAIGTAKVVKLLDPASGAVLQELSGHKNTIRSLAFTPDGKQLVTGGNDRTVNLWNLKTGEVEHSISDFQANVVGVAISPDGKWLAASCGTGDAVKWWKLAELDQPPHSFLMRQEYVPQLVFSPDSHLMAVPNWGGSIALKDVQSGDDVLQFSNVGSSECGSFSADGKWLALATQHLPIFLLPVNLSATDDQQRQITVLIERFEDDDYLKREAASNQLAAIGLSALPLLRGKLDAASPEVRVRCRRLVQRLQDADFAVKLVGHTQPPNCVAFSPDSKILASGDWQGIVKLWSVGNAKDITTLNPN